MEESTTLIEALHELASALVRHPIDVRAIDPNFDERFEQDFQWLFGRGEKNVPDDIRQIKAELAARAAEVTALKAENRKLEERLAMIETSHKEYVSKFGALPKPYEYREDECRPVGPHGTCELCGWEWDLGRRPSDKNKEPHPV